MLILNPNDIVVDPPTKLIANDIIVIGVDPGIRNTAITAIHFDQDKKDVICSLMLKSHSKSHKKYLPDSQVLNKIGIALMSIIRQFSGWNIAIGVESVFHTRFLTSAVSTGKVIGICHYMAGIHNMHCFEISPPTVKKALGLKGQAKKNEVVVRAEKLLEMKLKNHHLADSCGIAIATYLKIKRAAAEGKAVDTVEL